MLSPRRVFRATTFSMKGFKSAWETEAAFRDDIVLIFVTQVICLFAQPVWPLWLFFGLCNALLLCTELLNTGIEYLADHISTNQHDLLGRAKDVGSATIFIMLVFNGLVLTIILWRWLF